MPEHVQSLVETPLSSLPPHAVNRPACIHAVATLRPTSSSDASIRTSGGSTAAANADNVRNSAIKAVPTTRAKGTDGHDRHWYACAYAYVLYVYFACVDPVWLFCRHASDGMRMSCRMMLFLLTGRCQSKRHCAYVSFQGMQSSVGAC